MDNLLGLGMQCLFSLPMGVGKATWNERNSTQLKYYRLYVSSEVKYMARSDSKTDTDKVCSKIYIGESYQGKT